MRRLVGGLAALLCLGGAQAAEIPLYPTGPSEDAAFLRFFNAGAAELRLSAGNGAGLSLPAGSASDFLTVPAGKPIEGQLALAGQQQALKVSVAPGEFATVVGLPEAKGLRLVTVREQPDDFNALKASLAFYSLDPSCAQPGLASAGKNVAIFKDVADGTAQRRSINPLKLSVQLTCAGAPSGAALDLGQLAAGQRYTVFLAPSAQGPRLFQARDNLAN
ncbi:alginate O-acetyltransferase AlgF [Pseudomonas entomophila]|uniref:alginate O-acetyltransferase AlgF n=1 Tax=Pseudomonas entomophila TaxID=312306 RepID=UPI0023D86BC2|nr:alginate O-acetyltransferase AlgF [Pseudomonas entomophila]MDF0734244.1 alginate O-acetyltransferase AlgF [Pseudomonas entomophila]